MHVHVHVRRITYPIDFQHSLVHERIEMINTRLIRQQLKCRQHNCGRLVRCDENVEIDLWSFWLHQCLSSTHAHTCTHTHARTHTHTHARTHMHAHTCTHTSDNGRLDNVFQCDGQDTFRMSSSLCTVHSHMLLRQ